MYHNIHQFQRNARWILAWNGHYVHLLATSNNDSLIVSIQLMSHFVPISFAVEQLLFLTDVKLINEEPIADASQLYLQREGQIKFHKHDYAWRLIKLTSTTCYFHYRRPIFYFSAANKNTNYRSEVILWIIFIKKYLLTFVNNFSHLELQSV